MDGRVRERITEDWWDARRREKRSFEQDVILAIDGSGEVAEGFESSEPVEEPGDEARTVKLLIPHMDRSKSTWGIANLR